MITSLHSTSLKTVAIIQARMDSSRLPGKVLKKIAGRPMLGWVVDRAGRAQTVDQVVVATTTAPSDQAVADFCASAGYVHTHGDVYDVLNRYYQAAREFRADVIIRLTADCPLIDSALIDKTVQAFLDANPPPDYAANRLPPPWGRTYPIGLDVEVFSFNALEQAWKLADQKHQREHVTPYFYEDVSPEALKFIPGRSTPSAEAISERGFRVKLLHHTEDFGELRWTVDTPADLKLVRELVSYFDDDAFTWEDVLSLVEREPSLSQINAQIKHKTHLDTDERVKA